MTELEELKQASDSLRLVRKLLGIALYEIQSIPNLKPSQLNILFPEVDEEERSKILVQMAKIFDETDSFIQANLTLKPKGSTLSTEGWSG